MAEVSRVDESLMLSFDPVTDVLYVSFAAAGRGEARTHPLDDQRLVDYGPNGIVVGVEFLNASAGIRLEGVPEADRIRAAMQSLSEVWVLPAA
ncbi:MAG: DUF2283 domain-containing protein [Dehalococcoidia bacterium]|nr:DUF2283 domain-containing protein [Dehalococcoidia bacterium]